MSDADPRDLIRTGILDAELAALLWLLVEGGTPLVVTGSAPVRERSEVAAAILALAPDRAWSVIDATAEVPTAERLSALLRGGAGFALVGPGADLRDWLDGAMAAGLPEDGLRRLGVVVVVEGAAPGLRCGAVHYLRPSERDGQGHVQRRPPAVLATWDPDLDRHDHFAWGVTPELADRVDRAQADLEERQRDRAAFLAASLRAGVAAAYDELARTHLASEPPRVPAPPRAPATPTRLPPGPADPHRH